MKHISCLLTFIFHLFIIFHWCLFDDYPSIHILSAPLANPTPLKPTFSFLFSAAIVAQSVPATRNTALTTLSVAHLSINACVFSPSATPCSTALSSSDAEAREFIFSMSLSFTGLTNAMVKGTIQGNNTAAATLSLKGVDDRSSVCILVLIQGRLR